MLYTEKQLKYKQFIWDGIARVKCSQGGKMKRKNKYYRAVFKIAMPTRRAVSRERSKIRGGWNKRCDAACKQASAAASKRGEESQAAARVRAAKENKAAAPEDTGRRDCGGRRQGSVPRCAGLQPQGQCPAERLAGQQPHAGRQAGLKPIEKRWVQDRANHAKRKQKPRSERKLREKPGTSPPSRSQALK